ncbi:PAS domain S-box protein [Geothrix sp. 21YS21S-4]|uniref:PAS domain S-box protein n=1 Tax=Geothrix sp. 21YS21S-4 TaxID=3068889 RepID=UPI0027B8AC71|nr:PAS domain S-box protein [Geothrix sp. 21YS21S-4]
MQPIREPQDPTQALGVVRRYLEAAYRIPQAAAEARDLLDLFGHIHAIIRDLMPAENLYFAFWDRPTDTVSFPYWADAEDPIPQPRAFRRGLTEYVLRTGHPLLADAPTLTELEASGEVECIGTDPLAWLGAPLAGEQGVFGALVIQIYEAGRSYSPEERDLLVFVAGQAALVLERWRIETEQRILSAAMDRSADPIYGIDESGRLTFINQSACETLGYTRQELLAMTLWDVAPYLRPEEWPEKWAYVRHQANFRGEAIHRRKDGSLFSVEISSSFLAFEGREVIVSMARNITRRKAAEQALRASEEKFSKAFQASPDAIILSRMDGTILDVNDAFTHTTGWTREETQGQTTFELALWSEQSGRAKAMDLIRRDGHFADLEASFRVKDGSQRTGLISGAIIEVDGQPCMLSVTRDITERRQAEEALRHAQKLESLGVLAGGIAHDFNNLLTVVLGNLNLAQMHLREDSTARPYLTNMEATILRATELTKQMLAYSGRGHFMIKPHDLNLVVQDLTHLLEVALSKKVRLSFDLHPGLPPIQADAAQIQQVVMNLVTNASDAIGDREGAIHVATAVRTLTAQELQADYPVGAPLPGLHVILEVRDTGSGMTSEVMERIFDPFFTTKSAGRGLGLSAMVGILRGHRAGLHIASEVGRGSVFRLCFPAMGAVEHPDVTQAATGGETLLRGLVLLVDDEDQILEATGAALTALGCRVITARDGLEALERFRQSRGELDLVLMDLTMPRMDGREAFRAMRSLDPHVPVVLSSGFTEQDSLQALPGGGPEGFLQKPYQIRELAAVARKALEG